MSPSEAADLLNKIANELCPEHKLAFFPRGELIRTPFILSDEIAFTVEEITDYKVIKELLKGRWNAAIYRMIEVLEHSKIK